MFFSLRGSTIPFELLTNALRRFSPRIDDVLMEVAVSRCGSTIPIEFTHGLRHFSQADRRRRTVFMTRGFSGFMFRAGSGNFLFGVTTNVGW